MRLGILILHYNTPELTRKLADSIPEAIVIDNGSDSDKRYYGSNETKYFEKNLGFTAGWNKAVKTLYNRFDAFWLLNSDIKINQTSIKRIKTLITNSFIDIITPSYNSWMKCCNKQTNLIRSVDIIEFTAPLIKRKVFDKIGMFDETFSKGWGVEFDFCHRAKKAGFNIDVDDKSSFDHIGQQTINSTVGYDVYGAQAQKELTEGMIAKYGVGWERELFRINKISDLK